MADERIQQQIKISQSADTAIEAARVKLGMTKVELLSRVCQWFAGQPPMMQKLVLGLVDDELKGAAHEILLKSLTGKPTPPVAEPTLPLSHQRAEEAAARKQALGMVDAQAKKEADQKGKKRAG